MEYRAYKAADNSAIEHLFISVFTHSDGEAEGSLIGTLVSTLMATTDSQDLYGFVALDDEQIVGAIFFSRLSFEQVIDVFILAPVAVHTDYQGQGIGQTLIRYGLEKLKQDGVSVVTSYGDPAFYRKVGFEPVSQTLLPSPLALSQPQGWLGQSLSDDSITAIPGPSTCVKALDNPVYW